MPAVYDEYSSQFFRALPFHSKYTYPGIRSYFFMSMYTIATGFKTKMSNGTYLNIGDLVTRLYKYSI